MEVPLSDFHIHDPTQDQPALDPTQTLLPVDILHDVQPDPGALAPIHDQTFHEAPLAVFSADQPSQPSLPPDVIAFQPIDLPVGMDDMMFVAPPGLDALPDVHDALAGEFISPPSFDGMQRAEHGEGERGTKYEVWQEGDDAPIGAEATPPLPDGETPQPLDVDGATLVPPSGADGLTDAPTGEFISPPSFDGMQGAEHGEGDRGTKFEVWPEGDDAPADAEVAPPLPDGEAPHSIVPARDAEGKTALDEPDFQPPPDGGWVLPPIPDRETLVAPEGGWVPPPFAPQGMQRDRPGLADRGALPDAVPRGGDAPHVHGARHQLPNSSPPEIYVLPPSLPILPPPSPPRGSVLRGRSPKADEYTPSLPLRGGDGPVPLVAVGDEGKKYVPEDVYRAPPTNPSHPASNEWHAIVGEEILAEQMRKAGWVVFHNPLKNVSGKGFDFIALTPDRSKVALVDNKAFLRTKSIGNAGSLTGDQFAANLSEAKAFLREKHVLHPDAKLALELLEKERYIKVVGNGWGGEITSFTSGAFARGLHVWDVRLQKRFAPGEEAAWKAAYRLLIASKGLKRLPGTRGMASFKGMLLLTVLAAGTLFWLRSDAETRKTIKEAAGQFAAEAVVFGLVEKVLCFGASFGASVTIGMETDDDGTLNRIREEQAKEKLIDEMIKDIPDAVEMSPEELRDARLELRSLLENPLSVPERPYVPTIQEAEEMQRQIDNIRGLDRGGWLWQRPSR